MFLKSESEPYGAFCADLLQASPRDETRTILVVLHSLANRLRRERRVGGARNSSTRSKGNEKALTFCLNSVIDALLRPLYAHTLGFVIDSAPLQSPVRAHAPQ